MPDWLYLLTLYLGAWIILYLICRMLNTEKRGLIVKPLYFMYKTIALNRSLERISSKHRRAWRVLWNVGAALGLGQMILAIYFLGRNAILLFQRDTQAGPVQPIVPIPGVTISWENFPYIMLALVILLVTHELGHGIASLVDNVPLKSTGIFFAALIPGGFVEPDDQKLEKARYTTKLRVYAAGSSTNIIVALFFLFLMTNFTATMSPFYVQSGVSISGVREDFPAFDAGLRPGDAIYAINGRVISGVEELRVFMAKVRPGDSLSLSTNRGDIGVVTRADSTNSSRALIGITPMDHYRPKLGFLPPDLPHHILRAENWIHIIVISVALLNMLPLYPLDGDKFLDTILRAVGVKWSKEVRSVLSSVCIVILGLNFGLSYLRFGYVRI